MDKDKLMGVQSLVLHALQREGFNGAEVLFGTAEALGRLIYEFTDGTWIEKKQVMDRVVEHIERTVKAGVVANGGNLGDE
jgi:hypothetical protein